MMNYRNDNPYGEEEEEKVPNISKTRINDASGIQLTNSNYDQGSLEIDNGENFADMEKNMGQQLKNAGIDASRAA